MTFPANSGGRSNSWITITPVNEPKPGTFNCTCGQPATLNVATGWESKRVLIITLLHSQKLTLTPMADPTLTICAGMQCIWTITTDYGQVFSPTFLSQNRPGTADNSFLQGLSTDAVMQPQGTGYVWFKCTDTCLVNSFTLSLSRHVFITYYTYVDDAPPPGQWQLQLETTQPPACASTKCDPYIDGCPTVPTWSYYETVTCTASYDTSTDNTPLTTYYPYITFDLEQSHCGLDGRTQWLTLYSGPDNKSPVLAK